MMFASLLLMAAVTSSEAIGAWKVSENAAVMTDKRKSEGTVYSKDGNAILSFACSDSNRGSAPVRFRLITDKFLSAPSSLRGRGKGEIMFQIDGEPAETLRWYYGKHSAFTLGMSAVNEFGALLNGGKELLATVSTYRGQQVHSVFDISGASKMIDRVKLLCRQDA